jgi:hypothetical protein
VIGNGHQHILNRYEVDIPLVLVSRQSGQALRYAIEVGNPHTHGDERRQRTDAEKSTALQEAGWKVILLDIDIHRSGGLKRLPELVTGLALEIESDATRTLGEGAWPPHRFSNASSISSSTT